VPAPAAAPAGMAALAALALVAQRRRTALLP
jgi:MYXO-CTERM domain-containing protein